MITKMPRFLVLSLTILQYVFYVTDICKCKNKKSRHYFISRFSVTAILSLHQDYFNLFYFSTLVFALPSNLALLP